MGNRGTLRSGGSWVGYVLAATRTTLAMTNLAIGLITDTMIADERAPIAD